MFDDGVEQLALCPGATHGQQESSWLPIGQPAQPRHTVDLDVGYELVVHDGRLYVADGGNQRVLEYAGVPDDNGALATAVIGFLFGLVFKLRLT